MPNKQKHNKRTNNHEAFMTDNKKVVNIGEAKDKNKKNTNPPHENSDTPDDQDTESDKKERTKLAVIYENLYRNFEGHILNILPKPKTVIKAYQLRPGVKQPVIIRPNGECEEVGQEMIKDTLLNHCWEDLLEIPDYQLTDEQAKAAASFWASRIKPIGKPKMILLHEDEGLCFRKLPWPLKENPGAIHTPLFNELMSRIVTNKKGVMAFTWSLMEPKSFNQQYLWLHGEGNDGKGSYMRALLRWMGAIGAVQNTAPWKGNKHWAIPFIGKRLVIFPDFKDKLSLDNGILKSLTGGDSVYVDPKGTPGYTTSLDAKIIFSSQDMPNFPPTKSNLRRIIFAEFETTESEDADYEEKLWEEMPYFLWDCRNTYAELCPKHQRIPTDEESKNILKETAEGNSGDIAWVFNLHFERHASSSITPQEVCDRLCDYGHRDTRWLARFKEYLIESGIKKERIPRNSPYRYYGLKLRHDPKRY